MHTPNSHRAHLDDGLGVMTVRQFAVVLVFQQKTKGVSLQDIRHQLGIE
jgi:hypothetical protein